MFINKSNWISTILFIYSKTRFRIWIRMNKCTFEKMTEILNNDFIFHNESTCEQISLNEQLHLILFKFDNANEKINFVKFAITWNVSKNHVYNCTRRVVLTFFNLKKRYITWSNEKKKKHENMKNDNRVDFIDCVEKIDDIDIILNQKSSDEYFDEMFWNKKKKYVMNLCAICDFSKKFTYIYTS